MPADGCQEGSKKGVPVQTTAQAAAFPESFRYCPQKKAGVLREVFKAFDLTLCLLK